MFLERYDWMDDDELRNAIRKLEKRQDEISRELDAAYEEKNKRPSMNEEDGC